MKMEFPMNKLPLTVLSGLSGAGEATLPNHVLNIRECRRVAVIVDDMRLGKGGWRDLPDPFQRWARETDQDVLEEA